MRPAMSVVNLLLLFLLFNDIAEAIRLEQHSFESIHRISTQEAYLRGGGSSDEEVLCRDGETCSGTVNDIRRSFSEMKAFHHSLPGFHEDYVGPKKHNSKHH